MRFSMHGFLMGLGVSVVFISGFVAGQCTPLALAKRQKEIEVPPLESLTPTWEYVCYRAELTHELLQVANNAGEQGWEMVGTDGQGERPPVWCFKRRKKGRP